MFLIALKRLRKTKFYDVAFDYNEHLVERIRLLPEETRKFNPDTKRWEISTLSVYKLIKSYKGSDKIKFIFENKEEFLNLKNIEIQKLKQKEENKQKLQKWNQEVIEYKQHLEENFEQYSKEVHKYLNPNIKLYPHQIVGIKFLEKINSGLLALDLGSGKSLISITYSQIKNFNKVFVITPNSLKFNYFNEVKKFTNEKAFIINYKYNVCELSEAKFIITNYEWFATRDKKKINKKFKELNTKFECVICDESVRLKNTRSATFIHFKRLLGKTKNIVFMSGTPAPNRISELYTTLNLLSPLEFPTKEFYYTYYCAMFRGVYGWQRDYKSQPKIEELYNKLQPITYRKRKDEILKDLPDIIFQKVDLQMTNVENQLYRSLKRGVLLELQELKDTTNYKATVSILIKLRNFLSELKIKYISDIIDSIILEDERVIIVDLYKKPLYQLYEKYKNNACIHTGDQSLDERNKSVQEFESKKPSLNIFIGSIPTTKEGLTLVAATKVIILAEPYVPGDLDQIIARCHRIGQKNNITVYLPIFKKTIDESIYYAVEYKRKEILKAIDNIEYKNIMTHSVIDEVIKELKNEN